jgi:hypothetical protein
MKSRVHPTYKTKYHVGNWPEYYRALVQRGDITLWISADAIDAWKPTAPRKRGGQQKFSNVAIETTLTLRLVFKLPLRQTEGFLRWVLSWMDCDLEAPDHTTLSRRGQHLDVNLRRVSTGAAIDLIVDSSGLSIVGEGEWAAAKHGGKGKRGRKKLHLGVDRSGVIAADFDGLRSDGDRLRSDFDPWLVRLTDTRKYLEFDLNPTGVSSMKNDLDSLKKSADKLDEYMISFVSNLAELIESLAVPVTAGS